MGLLSALAQVWLVQRTARDLAHYGRVIKKPRETQQQFLLDLVRREQETGYGRDHHFSEIRTVADFRHRVPISTYTDLEPYIERVKQGDTEALFHQQRVVMFALTSGTTQARKFIPITERVLDQYRRMWTAWGLLAYAAHRSLFRHARLTIVSDWNEFSTPAGIPCGSISGMTAHLQSWVVRRGYVMPAASGKLTDVRAKYYLAWRLGVLRTIGSWMSPNPSTLLNLARFGEKYAETLLRDLYNGTLSNEFEWTDEVRAAVQPLLKPNLDRGRQLDHLYESTGRFLPKDVWPELGLIGCWTGGSMGTYLRSFPEFFGKAAVRDLGLLASEGRMTFPVADGTPSGVLEIVSNFFEFIPVSEIESTQPTILEAHELQEGGEYFVLLTNASGLYRYNIFDVVRCTGFHEKTPLLEFLNKGSGICSVTGEKLTDYQVSTALAQTLAESRLTLSAFALAPVWDHPEMPNYALFIEDGELNEQIDPQQFAGLVDRKLHALNIEYAAKRESQRLGPIRLAFVPRGFWDHWDQQRLQKSGGSVEQYKRPALLQQPPT